MHSTRGLKLDSALWDARCRSRLGKLKGHMAAFYEHGVPADILRLDGRTYAAVFRSSDGGILNIPSVADRATTIDKFTPKAFNWPPAIQDEKEREER